MRSLPPSQLYRELRAVDPKDYQRIIRRYEEKELEIGRLDVLENFELTVRYVDALFETGAYRKHQLMVDPVLHASIHHGIRRVPGTTGDIFEYQLFRKAASAYRLGDYPTAEHVIRELLRINSRPRLYFGFLRAILFHRRSAVLQFGRAACILCLLLTAVVVTANLLVVRNFYPAWADAATALSGATFLLGLLTLGLAYGYAFWLAHREARHFKQDLQNKRRP